MDNTNLTPIVSNPYTLSPATAEETAKVLENYEKTGRPLPGFLVKGGEVYRITYPGEVTPEAEFSPGLEYVNDKVDPLVPGPGEVIVGGEDGPVALAVSEIVAGKADADHRHDNVYLYATSRNNPTSLPLKIDPVSIDGRTQFVASVPAAGRYGEYGTSNTVARADHVHTEDDITGLAARLSTIEARLDALEEPEA